MVEITKQPWLRCCANCKHFWEGYDGCGECLYERVNEKYDRDTSVDQTDICKKYEQQGGEVR